MDKIWIIARRELAAFFDSLTAYILLAAFLGFSGFFTWLYGADVFLVGQASLRVFFGIAFWTLFFFIPALTMRQLAEENSAGTLELLLTKPVSQLQIALGKFLGSFILIAIALALTLPYYITVANIGHIDHGATICGYIGLLLVSAVYISIGLFASSLTGNQIVSFLTALLIGIFFHLVFGMLGGSMSGFWAEVFYFLSTQNHFESISRGVIDSRDLLYFLSATGLGLFGTVYVLSQKGAE